MSDKPSTRRAAAQSLAAFPFPGFPVNTWWPALACYSQWNAGLQESIAKLGGEWQDFASRRMSEDSALLQRLAAARSPEQVLAAYIAFWQKAADDYSQEFVRAATLAGDLMNRNLAAMQRQVGEATTAILPLEKAA
jgi:hypothetical protein